jgi:hypothetical protein
MPTVDLIAALLPEIHGLLPLIFVGILVLLTILVGAFALFVIAQQFRNPGRPIRR